MASTTARTIMTTALLLGALPLPGAVLAQTYTNPLDVDTDGLLPIDFEPLPHLGPIASLRFNIDGDTPLETIAFSAPSPDGIPAIFGLGSIPGNFPTPTKALTSKPDTNASLPITIAFGEPVGGFTFDLIDPQFPTPEILGGLAGLDPFTTPLGEIIEALDAQGDPRGTVVEAFDAIGNPVSLGFIIGDLDPDRPVDPRVSQLTDLSASGGGVLAISIPGDGNAGFGRSDLLTLTVLRVSVFAEGAPFSSLTVTPAVPDTEGVPPGGDFILLDNLSVPVMEVAIDIKPGSFPNSINLSSAGVVPVAILSSEAFDATGIDPSTVSLAGAGVKMVGKAGRLLCNAEDVDSDGLLDLVCHVVTAQLMLGPADTTAVLQARTFDGILVRGEDSVRIVPPDGNGTHRSPSRFRRNAGRGRSGT